MPSVTQLQLDIVFMLQTDHPVGSAPFRSQFCVFRDETAFVEQNKLTLDEFVRLSLPIDIVGRLGRGSLIVAPSNIPSCEKT